MLRFIACTLWFEVVRWIWSRKAATHRHHSIGLFGSIKFITILKSSFSKAAPLIVAYQRVGGQI
jgi:hypothetical protein